jgi:hypothetical protein
VVEKEEDRKSVAYYVRLMYLMRVQRRTDQDAWNLMFLYIFLDAPMFIRQLYILQREPEADLDISKIRDPERRVLRYCMSIHFGKSLAPDATWTRLDAL